MIHARAALLCEDVRVEVDGTLTVTGLHNERLIVRGDTSGPIALERLIALVILAGMRGVVEFRARARFVRADDRTPDTTTVYLHEEHDPDSDEHNLVFAHAPIVFAGVGHYNLVVEVDRGREVVRYRFELVPA